MLQFIEFDDFQERMACQAIWVRGRYLFQNGGQSDGELRHKEPPRDHAELLSLKHEFINARLASLTQRYKTIRQAVKKQADFHAMGAGPTADTAFPNWRKDLTDLSAEIEKLQTELQQVTAQLPRTEQQRSRNHAYEERQQQAAKCNEELQEFPTY